MHAIAIHSPLDLVGPRKKLQSSAYERNNLTWMRKKWTFLRVQVVQMI
jgi:hypothetical protein